MAKKVVLVTGASRGIGKAIAVKFAKKGYNVVISCAHREAELMQAKKEIEGYQVSCLAFLGDMGDMSTCETMFQQIKKQFGTLDVLVNNAGITKDGLLMAMSEEDFCKVVDTNLKGTFNCIRHTARQMLKQRSGRIVNMASVVGIGGNPGQANYAASKAGIIGLTKTAAKELASRGITVNAIAPGFIRTDMTDVLPDKVKEETLKNIPMGTFGEPEDVAKAAAFFASPEAKYITGQVLCVDGGML